MFKVDAKLILMLDIVDLLQLLVVAGAAYMPLYTMLLETIGKLDLLATYGASFLLCHNYRSKTIVFIIC